MIKLINPEVKKLVEISKEILAKDLTKEEKKYFSEEIFYKLTQLINADNESISHQEHERDFNSFISGYLVYPAFFLNSNAFLSKINTNLEKLLVFLLIQMFSSESILLNYLADKVVSKHIIDVDEVSYLIGFLFGRNFEIIDDLAKHCELFHEIVKLRKILIEEDIRSLILENKMQHTPCNYQYFISGFLEGVKDKKPNEKLVEIAAVICYSFLVKNLNNLPEGEFTKTLKSFVLIESL